MCLAAFLASASASASAPAPTFWHAAATLHGRELECELRTLVSGRAELLPAADYGRGCGQWRRRASGVFEGSMQLYLYTLAVAPSDPTEIDVLCVQTSPNELRGLLFEPQGERPQVGARLPSLPMLPLLATAFQPVSFSLSRDRRPPGPARRLVQRHAAPRATALSQPAAPPPSGADGRARGAARAAAPVSARAQ